MKLNSKISWIAAWSGLALVVLVPSADFLTGGRDTPTALITSDTDPVKTATITPAPVVTPAATTAPRVVLPASVGTSPAAIKPAPTVTVSAPADTQAIEPEVETASLGVSATNPPFPAPRPKTLSASPVVAAPAPTTVATTPRVVVAPPAAALTPDQPLIIDEDSLNDRVATSDPDRPTPPAGIASDPAERETLTEYLARRGLLDDGRSSASVVYSDADQGYDPDGFYLDQGPNNDSRNMTPQQWRRWMLAHGVDPDELEPF